MCDWCQHDNEARCFDIAITADELQYRTRMAMLVIGLVCGLWLMSSMLGLAVDRPSPPAIPRLQQGE